MTLTFLMLGGAVIPATAAGGSRPVPSIPLKTTEIVPATELIPVSGLAAAEDLLDCLEARGFRNCTLVIREDGTFAVRPG
jgi:hypothetical protein